MQPHSHTFGEMFASAWRHRDLLMRLAHREVAGRYKGSMGGIGWALLTPLILLTVYTLVFGVIFESRWAGTADNHFAFAAVLFSGQLVFGLFAECVTRGPRLILERPEFVKKVVFPLEILPWVTLSNALFHAFVCVILLLPAIALVFGSVPVTAILLPIVLLPVMVLGLGAGWLLGALGVYLRDIEQLVGLIISALMFLSPVFYPLDRLPSGLAVVLALSPLAITIEATRDVLIWGRMPDFASLAMHFVVASVIAWGGFAWFQKTRRGFADVL